MNTRVIVYTLLFLIVYQVSVGIWTLFSNLASAPFDFHRFGAAAVLIIFVFKGRVIYRSLRRQIVHRRVLPRTHLSLFLLFELVAVLLFGLLWFFRLLPTFITGSTTPLDLHIWIALTVLPIALVHAVQHLRNPRLRAPVGRRQAIGIMALGVGAAVLWQLTVLGGLLTNPPGSRRFTGSRDVGSCPTCYPPTVWFFDTPPVIDIKKWTLTVRGNVERELVLNYSDIASGPASVTAFLDCTGGWSSHLDWQGVEVSQLLNQAGVKAGAAIVIFRSATGRNAPLPLGEAATAILATHVEGEVLTPEHGFPLRLVAPARRGFQWIKWLTEVEVV